MVVANAVMTARECIHEEIAKINAAEMRRGLWEDEKAVLETLRRVLSWMDAEQAQRDAIEAEAALAEQAALDAEKPEVKYAETRALFNSYKQKTGRR